MNGRVKTLHPRIFGGILADRSNEQHILDLADLSTELIDLVVVNLYPFKSEAVDKKLDFSIAQIINEKENQDMPSSSSLDQRFSDVVGHSQLEMNDNIKLNGLAIYIKSRNKLLYWFT